MCYVALWGLHKMGSWTLQLLVSLGSIAGKRKLQLISPDLTVKTVASPATIALRRG